MEESLCQSWWRKPACLEFRVQGLWFRVQGLGSRVQVLDGSNVGPSNIADVKRQTQPFTSQRPKASRCSLLVVLGLGSWTGLGFLSLAFTV